MSEKMTVAQVHQVAKIAAMQAIGSVREQITDVVLHELPNVMPPGQSKNKENIPKYSRRFFEVKEFTPSSNYTKVLMASAMWRVCKGPSLGTTWMYKPDTRQKLLIEQYGPECSVLRMDMAQKSAKFDVSNKMIEPGKSIWTDFVPVKGVIEDVVSMQAEKGWVLVPPERKHQLEIVDAVS